MYIKSGTITTDTVLGDGIQADSFVYIKDGTFNLTTTPTWNDGYVASANKENGIFDRTNHQKVARDNVRAGSAYAVFEESVKGIKVGEIDYYLKSDADKTELTVSSDMTQTQSDSKGLSQGNHTVTIGGNTVSYYNAYTYRGYTTVYATSSATIN